jgi:soluble lytic murein transglycosylase
VNKVTLQRGALLLGMAAVVGAAYSARAQDRSFDDAARPAPRLAPTAHPALPARASQYWLVPDAAVTTEGLPARFARAVKLFEDRQFEAAQALIDPAAFASSPLAEYALYYKAVALMGLNRYSDAETWLTALQQRRPQGYLREALGLRLSDLALARGDVKRAVGILDDLTGEKLSAPEDVWLQLGRAAERAADRDKALKAYRKVYYEYPLAAQAVDAQAGIERLQTADLIPPDRFKLELARAGRLFDAKRWAQARAAFEPLARVADGDNAELVALRIAECDYYLDRARAARDELRPYLKGTSREAEARFFYLTATRALGDRATYVALARDFVSDFPDGSWTEEVLNNLASHYIIEDEDDAADATFRDLYQRFPESRYAERAAWKIGWRAYRTGNYAEAAQLFDEAAAAYPRADYRPSWLYWSGRARDKMGDSAQAAARYRLVVADYENSYYGRLASKLLTGRSEAASLQNVSITTTAAAMPGLVPTDPVVRQLIALELYDLALREVQYAQRVWGDTPQLQATVAFIRHNQSLELSGFDRFNALRGAITIMRRAYPQFMAAGGEDLPPDVLRIIFPLDYWNLITKYSAQHDLDPYLVAALMAQESTFTPEIRSAANAYGLMQLVPDAGRQYARKVGIRRFKTSMLTEPETNIRLGTLYFRDLIDKFGGAYLALASYNAGPNRVAQWLAEKPGLPQDEFIDDIPFPETQNYVKRILGTAEDYRHLYGGGLLDPNESLHVTGAAMTPRTSRSVRAVSSSRDKASSVKPKPKGKSKAKAKAAVPAKKKPATRKSPRRRRSSGA